MGPRAQSKAEIKFCGSKYTKEKNPRWDQIGFVPDIQKQVIGEQYKCPYDHISVLAKINS